MTKNKKNFLINIIGAIGVFLLGIVFISLPTYYGIDMIKGSNINDLFLCFVIIYATLNLVLFFLNGKKKNNEMIYLCMVASVAGLINIILTEFTSKSFIISFALLVFMITAVKLFTIDYYHDRKDAFYYIEALGLIIFFLTGVATAINLFGDALLQTIMLGFFIAIMGILRIFNVSIKAMLKSKRFLNKIKLK